MAVFRGALLNKIKRWHDCLVEYDADGMVCIDGDDLAVDFDIAKRVAEMLIKGDADVYETPKDVVCGLLTHAFTRQAIDVGGGIRFATIAADRLAPDVIDENKDNIRALLRKR